MSSRLVILYRRMRFSAFLIGTLLLAACAGQSSPKPETPPLDPPRSSAPRASSSRASSVHSSSIRKPVATWDITTVATNLDTPWDIAIASDGALYVTERHGSLKRIETDGRVTDLGRVPNVVEQSESGLTGIALDPAFGRNRWIYLAYSYRDSGIKNRVSRFTLADDRMSDERILVDGLSGGPIHNGGRLRFGPDGKLWILTGDGGNASTAQDRESLGGKVLRINADGSIPSDNPFLDSPVYSLGHRNPQGLAWTDSGTLYVSEHGNSAHDEINRIEREGNYGWPLDTRCGGSHGTGPVFCTGTQTWAPSGLAFLPAIADLSPSFFLATLRGSTLRRLEERNGQLVPVETVIDGIGRLRAVTTAPDGSLYVSTSNRDGRGQIRSGDDRILRIQRR